MRHEIRSVLYHKSKDHFILYIIVLFLSVVLVFSSAFTRRSFSDLFPYISNKLMWFSGDFFLFFPLKFYELFFLSADIHFFFFVFDVDLLCFRFFKHIRKSLFLSIFENKYFFYFSIFGGLTVFFYAENCLFFLWLEFFN